MMNVKVTFEADSVERLREQLLLFLNVHQAYAPAEPPKEPKKAKAPEPSPPPPEEPLVTDKEEVEPETMEEAVTPEAENAVFLLKLKEQQLSRLRDLFNAGKGAYVRELLAKYGNGAKVFPEVEAKHFPAIKVDMDKELGA